MSTKTIRLQVSFGEIEGAIFEPRLTERVTVPFTAEAIVGNIPNSVRDVLHYELNKKLDLFNRILEMDKIYGANGE